MPMEIVGLRKNHKSGHLNMLGSFQQKNKTIGSYAPQPPHRKSSKSIMKYDSALPGYQMWHKKPSSRGYQRHSTSLDARLLSDEEERYSIKNLEVNHWCNRRANSSSPVRRPAKSATDDTRVAFGRKISREFTFAEEKKRLEEEFSKIYKDVTVSTRILKNPDLKSNQQVKFALQNSLEPLTKTLICTRRNRNQYADKSKSRHISFSNFYANKSVREGLVKLKKTNTRSHSNSTISLDLIDSNTKAKRKVPNSYQYVSNKTEEVHAKDKNQINKKDKNNYFLAKCSNEFFFENSTDQLNFTKVKTGRSVSSVNARNNNVDRFDVTTKNEQINYQKFSGNDYSDIDSNTSRETNKCRRQSRSPSIRRIQSIKQQLVIAQSKQKNLRSRSLSNSGFYCIHSESSQMDRSFSLNSVSQTPDSFRINHFERFQELTNFYSSLERIGQLEKAISQTDLRRKDRNEIREFNFRQRIRAYEKAEKELKFLTDTLRDQQDKKNVFFQAQDPDKIRWNERKDAGLRVRDKSVEDLKQVFVKKNNYNVAFHQIDVKPSLGRDNSVLERAYKMATKYGTTNEDSHLVNHGLSPKLLGTLSSTQKSKLIDQLNEIYTNYDKKRNPNAKNVNFNTFPLKKRSSSEPPRLVSTMCRPQSVEPTNKTGLQEKCTEKEFENTDESKLNKTNLNTVDEENVKNNRKNLNNELKHVCLANQKNHIKNKIDYFEHIQSSKYIPTTIYHARECSSGEDEALPNDCKRNDRIDYSVTPVLTSSQSFSDIREIFGESKQYLPSIYCTEVLNQQNPNNFNSLPANNCRKVSGKLQNLNPSLVLHRTDVHLRRFQSDSELDNMFFSSSRSAPNHNPNKFDSKMKHDHAPSPIPRSPLRKTSIYMPHINVISKTASLKKEIGGIVKPIKHEVMLGESIKKIKNKLEMQGFNVYGQMFASAPDIREFKDVSSYLSANWIAHQYPKPEDNGKITNEMQATKGIPVHRGRDSRPLLNQMNYLSQYCDWFSSNSNTLDDSKKALNDKFYSLKLEKSLKTTSEQTQFRDDMKGLFLFCRLTLNVLGIYTFYNMYYNTKKGCTTFIGVYRNISKISYNLNNRRE
jgi:sorbin and SH3 domain containing protein 1